jgi:transcriptional regulator with XRE-family HTH domain
MIRMLVSSSVDEERREFSSVDCGGVADPRALAVAVRQRRAELAISQEHVRATSGLSVTTISKIERGDPDLNVQKATLRRLDLALQWPVGSAESWLEGRGGIVTGPALEAPDLMRWAEELAPLVAHQLRAGREAAVQLSVEGVPEDVVAALDDLVRVIRNHFVHRR